MIEGRCSRVRAPDTRSLMRVLARAVLQDTTWRSRAMNFLPTHFEFDRYLPLFDPDAFSDVEFYRGLEEIGYRQVLLGGTGAADLAGLVAAIRTETRLQVVLYPAGPDSVTAADLVVLPDVMNSNSHYARPFGSGAVATAMNIAARRLPYLPVAYFIMGNSTARWYFDAFLIHSHKIVLGYATYARMVGYRHLALDYEDPDLDCDPRLLHRLRQIEDMHILVSDEFSPATAIDALEHGAHTIITPSDVYEETADPLALAAKFHARLLAGDGRSKSLSGN